MEKEILLYKYFEGSLSPSEQDSFELFLKEDEDFRLQFELEKDVQKAVQNSNREVLKSKLQGFENERSKTSSPKRLFWKPLRIAASIAILLGASWFIFNSVIFDGPEELFATHYEKYPNTAYTITRGDANDNSLERKAFEAYERNDYNIAIRSLKKLKEKTGLDYVDFYLGQSYLANGDTEEAILIFEKINAINSDFKSEALWYEALAQLQLKEKPKAISKLKTLIEDGSFKKEEAENLLKNLQ